MFEDYLQHCISQFREHGFSAKTEKLCTANHWQVFRSANSGEAGEETHLQDMTDVVLI